MTLTRVPHVSIPTAAGILGVHPVTLRRWIRLGKIPVLQLPGKQPRISRATIERLLENKSLTNVDIPAHHRIH